MKIDRNLIARINRRLLAERKAQGVAGEKIHKVRAGWMRREFGEYALRKLSGELVTYGFDIRLMARIAVSEPKPAQSADTRPLC